MMYIHIGMHKTGSSSIQRFAANNTELLARHGIVFPSEARRKEGHHFLKKEMWSDGDEMLTALHDAVAAEPGKNFFLSSESLSTFRPAAIRRLVDAIAPDGRVTILLYVRSGASLVVSRYNQSTKRGLNVASFDNFFRHHMQMWVTIQNVVESWGGVVGYDALRVRSLEAATAAEGGLLGDLLSALGLSPSLLGEADPASIQRVNIGPSWEAAEYIRECGRRIRQLLEDTGDQEIRQMAGSARVPIRSVKRKNVKKRQVMRFRATSLLKPLQAALDDAGEAPPMQYLTQAQVAEIEEAYRTQLASIAAVVKDAQLDHTPPAPLPERAFEPSYEDIPQERRKVIDAVVREQFDFEKMPKPLRELFPWVEALPAEARETS